MLILIPVAITLAVVLYALWETVRIYKGTERVSVIDAFMIGFSRLMAWIFALVVTLVAWLIYFAFT